jgi:hypothetical protein
MPEAYGLGQAGTSSANMDQFRCRLIFTGGLAAVKNPPPPPWEFSPAAIICDIESDGTCGTVRIEERPEVLHAVFFEGRVVGDAGRLLDNDHRRSLESTGWLIQPDHA